MIDHLVKTQEQNGHASGSWYFKGGQRAYVGGRVYNTAMATLILETSYRNPKIYTDERNKADKAKKK